MWAFDLLDFLELIDLEAAHLSRRGRTGFVRPARPSHRGLQRLAIVLDVSDVDLDDSSPARERSVDDPSPISTP